MDDLKHIEESGREAAERGTEAAACPFTFINSPYWASKDYVGFDRNYRPKMDAWMKGWIKKAKETKNG